MKAILASLVTATLLLAGCDFLDSGNSHCGEIMTLRDRVKADPSDRAALDAIIAWTRSYSDTARANAVNFLGELTADPKLRPVVLPSAMPVYLRALHDPFESVRYNAVASLRAMHHSASPALPELRALPSSEAASVRELAQHAIHDIE